MQILLLLFWCILTEYLIQDTNKFRAFQCLCLSLLSVYNLFIMDLSTLQKQTVVDLPSVSMISTYIQVYLIYDLKNAWKRMDLFIHHIVVILWVYINHSTSIASLCILNEIVTTSYLISKPVNQWLFRILIVCFIRYPIWIITYFTTYESTHLSFAPLLINKIIIYLMLGLDLIWLRKYVLNYNNQIKQEMMKK
jgi:hypothetical protein